MNRRNFFKTSVSSSLCLSILPIGTGDKISSAINPSPYDQFRFGKIDVVTPFGKETFYAPTDRNWSIVQFGRNALQMYPNATMIWVGLGEHHGCHLYFKRGDYWYSRPYILESKIGVFPLAFYSNGEIRTSLV